MAKNAIEGVERYREPHPYELYVPKGAGPFPLVCLTPMLGRLLLFPDLRLERFFARFFAAHGLMAALIGRPIFVFDAAKGLEQIHDYLEGSVSRNQDVLDDLATHAKVDMENVGTFGVSFGGIVNCLWASGDPRLKAHVFALCGGNIPEICLSSRDPLMKSYMKAALRSVGGDHDRLKEKLKNLFPADPNSVAHAIPPERVLLILALFDRIVRLRYGLALRKALGRPATVFLPLGHYLSILAGPILKWQALLFLKSKLT